MNFDSTFAGLYSKMGVTVNRLKPGCVIFSRVVYDAQFTFVTIYKVGERMMPSVLKICSDFKSCSVFQPLVV